MTWVECRKMPADNYQFRLALRKFRLRQLSVEQLPEVAINLLEIGLDSPALRMLAASLPSDTDLERLIEKTAVELGVSLNKEEAALDDLKEALSKVVNSGRFDHAAAKILFRAQWRSSYECIRDAGIRSEAQSLYYTSWGFLDEVDEGFLKPGFNDEAVYKKAMNLLERIKKILESA